MAWTPSTAERLQTYPPLCIHRIKRDLANIVSDPPSGIVATSHDSDITLVHALITGPADTPYEGGFFYFLVRFPQQYPMHPPKVKFMTTGGSRVRFNPNLYKNGKVCLSILGTWSGPQWAPVHTLSSVLISIQSLLCENPYHNEPGFEDRGYPEEVQRYNDFIQHETLRVAVVGMLDNGSRLSIPSDIKKVMEKSFLQHYDGYDSLARSKVALTDKPMYDPFGGNKGTFQWETILQKLAVIRTRLTLDQPNHLRKHLIPTKKELKKQRETLNKISIL